MDRYGERKSFGGRSRFGSGRRDDEGSFGGRRSFDSGKEAPVKEGETYDVTISEVGSKGDGIARISNFVVFVPGTKQNESVKIRIKEVKGRCAVGEKVEAGEKAADTEAEASDMVEVKTDETQ